MEDAFIQAYNEAVYDTDREKAMQVIQSAERSGYLPEDIVFRIVIPAVEQMMDGKNRDFEMCLAQHFMTAQIASEIVDAMIPRFKQSPEKLGRVVIGTSVGDFHGLGKRIVAGCLRSRMIDVIDLGFNVPANRFVAEALAQEAQVIGISSMMVHTACGGDACLGVRRLLHERGLEERIKVIVGGAPYRHDPRLAAAVGADTWAEDGILAVRAVTELIAEVLP